MDNKNHIKISLEHIEEGLELVIDSKKDRTLFDKADAEEYGEARYQLREGCFYDYELTFTDSSKSMLYLLEKTDFVIPRARKVHMGTIAPNIYVGTLSLTLIHAIYKDIQYPPILLEVQSLKTDYRTDYRDMLEYITARCTELLMQADSPVAHYFEPDFTKDNQSLYQKFAFIKSIIHSSEFNEAVHRVVTNPVTRWKETVEQKDIRNFKKFTNKNIRELVSGSNRTLLPNKHLLYKAGLESLPVKLTSGRKIDCVDTAENRFIKYALEVFLKFCTDINKAPKAFGKLVIESDLLIKNLEGHLNHSIFKEISRPSTLKLNSPILQRKEGYREILHVWLMFDLAARLVWTGGDDVYHAGKKNIAVLYEYWLFFKMLELLKELFQINPKSLNELIQKKENEFNLQLKQGNHTALEGVYLHSGRTLSVRFSYNRSFGGGKKYPEAGSWTTSMRPDYTLSVWPAGITEAQAEEEELIVHIHFDAKYKIENFTDLLQEKSNNALNSEKEENRKGVYKNADILKMHAYKDAIRRTGGAYVLYPGDKSDTKKGFHEIIPGLGAFPVRPAKTDSGIEELKSFIFKVIDHFINRASQRENLAFRVYDIHKNENPNELKEVIPELFGANRNLVPDETYVLLGFSRNQKRFNWYLNYGLYNFRMDDDEGSLVLDKEVTEAKYLLLRQSGNEIADKIFRIVSSGPKVYSKEKLEKLGYPEPSKSHYLVIEIEEVNPNEFGNSQWEFTKLKKYRIIKEKNRNRHKMPGIPFTVTLTELMTVKKK